MFFQVRITFQVSNGDELYSVTAVYLSKDINGSKQIGDESVDVKYFHYDELPNGLTEEYRRYINSYFNRMER
ncbi:hypothetical protein GCM10009001_10760 [Virgibacillus siamensis]|uniref:NUDIX hydrolase n=1 Tax=Virgibacillus siamensis TaxID=480071 RepID=A0ABN1FS13_9BACI